MCISNAFFSGIGYGFIFGPSMAVVGKYFNKCRGQANALTVAGGSLGQVVIPFLLVSFVNTFNFQGGIMLYAALTLHAIPAALLLRPLQGRQKVEDNIVEINNCPTEDSRVTLLTGDTHSNSHPHTSQESLSNPTLLYNDADFAQNNPIYEDVSLDKDSWTVPSDMNTQSLIDMSDLGFGYSDIKPMTTQTQRNCQEFMRWCSDPTIAENEQYNRTTQRNLLDNVSGYKCCKAKCDSGLLSNNTERDNCFNRIGDYRIDKSHSKMNLEEHRADTADELGDFLLLYKETEYDILDEISRECSITHSRLQDSDVNVAIEDNASEAGTLCSDTKDELSTKKTDEDIVCVADDQMPSSIRESFNTELTQSFSDIFKVLETSVPRIDFDVGESSDFNFSVGSLNFDFTDHMKKEKTSRRDQNITHDFITNSDNEGTDDKSGSTQEKEKHIEHKQISLQCRKKPNKHSKTSEHRKKVSKHKKKPSEHRRKTRKQNIRPAQKEHTSNENMDRILLFSSENNNCKILSHGSNKINSNQQDAVSHNPKASDLRNSVSNYTTLPNFNSDEWSGFLKSNALFSSNNFVFDDSIKTSSTNELATLLHEELDSTPKETSAIYKHSSLPSTFKQLSFYKCCKLFVNKVLEHAWLLTNRSYILFATGLAFSHSGYMNGCFYLPAYAAETGHSDSAMALLVSVMGVADMLGRIAGGFCLDQSTFKSNTLLGSLLIVCGLMTLLMTSYPQLWMLVFYGIFHSLLCSAYMSRLVVALVDVVGIENISSGIGSSTILIGMFMLPTSSILGKISTFSCQYANNK